MNEEIVKQFYNIYFRVPRRTEFVRCGGSVSKVEKKYGNYTNFIKKLGFEIPHSRTETYNVINTRGVIIFTGTIKSIAEEFNTSRMNVNHAILHDGLYKNEYKVEKKTFTTAVANSIRKEVALPLIKKERDLHVKKIQTYLLNNVNISESTALGIAKVLYKFKEDKTFLQLIKGD